MLDDEIRKLTDAELARFITAAAMLQHSRSGAEWKALDQIGHKATREAKRRGFTWERLCLLISRQEKEAAADAARAAAILASQPEAIQ